MRNHILFYAFAALALTCSLHFRAHAAPSGSLIKHLSSLLKLKQSNTKTSQSDENVLQFENGYVVETLVEGNDIGVIPYRIRVSEEDELFAVDAINSNIVRITPPVSQYSRGRLVAGSFLGYTGHVDGKPSDARFNHPKGIALDDKGNVYVADTRNLAIRKIGDAGVTTIAGGKSNVAGYRDGPGEDAKLSSDFDVVYVRPTCSLLVIDRGNAALRPIVLNQEDCNYQSSSISMTEIKKKGFSMCEEEMKLPPPSRSSLRRDSPSPLQQKRYCGGRLGSLTLLKSIQFRGTSSGRHSQKA